MGRKRHHEETEVRGHANGEANGHAKTEPPPANTPAGAVERRRYTEALPCKLEGDKLAELRLQLVDATTHRVGKEAEVAYLREEIKGLKEREAKLVGKIERGTEDGPVEVVEYLLPDNSVQAVRTDTGEVLSTRTAEAEDLQDEIPFGDEPAQPEIKDDVPGEGDIDDPAATLGEGA